jgi:calcium binding protein 39
MKEILYGTNEKDPQTEAVAQLAQELYNSGLLSTLVADLQLIDFEVRNQFLNFEKQHLTYSLFPYVLSLGTS